MWYIGLYSIGHLQFTQNNSINFADSLSGGNT